MGREGFGGSEGGGVREMAGLEYWGGDGDGVREME